MILQQSNKALTRKAIANAYQLRFGEPIAYATVSIRLDELIATQLVEKSGYKKRGMKYQAVARTMNRGADGAILDAHSAPPSIAQSETTVPLSTGAQRLRTLLELPRGNRSPAGYDPEFLDAYIPGRTWYLAERERTRLNELGRTTYVGQPAGTYARDIMERLVIDLSWGSSRLEGLRYSRIDTAELLAGARTPTGASDRDRQLILNHKSAIEFLVENAESIAFNRFTILNLHALLAENLLERREEEGALRVRPVTIGSSVYTPTAIPQLIEERFDTVLAKAQAITDPIEQSFFVMVHLPYLQPFIDVNKRTSRLAANIPLIRSNLCPLSFVDVPEGTYTQGILGVYEQRDVRLLADVYAWAYERSCAQFKVLCESMGEPDPIRLNYRSQLRSIVSDIVRGGRWPTPNDVVQLASKLGVPNADMDAVTIEALRDLRSLRPEILARYALRQSEYEVWAQVVSHLRGAEH